MNDHPTYEDDMGAAHGDGRYEKHPAHATRAYASFTEATTAFLIAIGLVADDISHHFPGMEMLPLFRNMGGPS